MRILPVGEAALSVEFADRIDPEAEARVRALDAALAADPPPGFVEAVPSYRSLLVIFDPLAISAAALGARVTRVVAGPVVDAAAPTRTLTIPVLYGGEAGPDLADLAAGKQMTAQQAAMLHAAAAYRVVMIGFLPGFAYLSGLPDALATPRRATPRTRVPAGSVMIGGVQAGIAPIDMPSGWHVIGRTPVRPFDLGRDPPFLFAPDDRLRFAPIDQAAYDRIAGDVARGSTGLAAHG